MQVKHLRSPVVRRLCLAVPTVLLTTCQRGAAVQTDRPSLAASVNEPTASAPVKPAAEVTVVNRGPGRFGLRTTGTVELATTAALERRSEDGKWTAYPSLDGERGYRLVERCHDPSTETAPCLTLVPGKLFVPEPWSGFECAAQCGKRCPGDAFHAGTHRWVVTACNNAKSRFEGESFEMPASEAILVRERAVADVVQGTVARLDARGADDGTLPSAPGKVAGFVVHEGTERPLAGEELALFSRWMTSSEGFDDKVVRRCARGHLVGIRLMNRPDGREATTEVALDFACNSILIAREQGGRRVATGSFFDASRAVILPIMKRSLPTDTELGRLR